MPPVLRANPEPQWGCTGPTHPEPPLLLLGFLGLLVRAEGHALRFSKQLVQLVLDGGQHLCGAQAGFLLAARSAGERPAPCSSDSPAACPVSGQASLQRGRGPGLPHASAQLTSGALLSRRHGVLGESQGAQGWTSRASLGQRAAPWASVVSQDPGSQCLLGLLPGTGVPTEAQ